MRPPTPSAALLALLSVAALAPSVLRAQEIDVSRMTEEERERLRLARPAEVPASPGAEPLPLDSLRPGMRVIVTAVGMASRRQGVILGFPARDTLIFDGVRNRELVRVPVSRLTMIEVSTGITRGHGISRLGTSLIGVAAGFLVGSLLSGDDGSLLDAGSITASLVGGTIGYGLGRTRERHAWRPVALPRR
jgi:hypothetical protein